MMLVKSDFVFETYQNPVKLIFKRHVKNQHIFDSGINRLRTLSDLTVYNDLGYSSDALVILTIIVLRLILIR